MFEQERPQDAPGSSPRLGRLRRRGLPEQRVFTPSRLHGVPWLTESLVY